MINLRESIKNDYLIFDDLRSMEITHNGEDAAVTFDETAGVGTVRRNRTFTIVEGCLIRQPSLRNGPSVPQIHERDVAVQKDSATVIDTVIEVPLLDGLIIKEEDTIRDIGTDERWMIVSIDYSTLKTRYRLGCARPR